MKNLFILSALKKEREWSILAIIIKKRINEIKRLKEEVKNNEDKLLDSETKISKLLTDLEYAKNDTVHNIVVLKLKLIKLKISPERIGRIKNLALPS